MRPEPRALSAALGLSESSARILASILSARLLILASTAARSAAAVPQIFISAPPHSVPAQFMEFVALGAFSVPPEPSVGEPLLRGTGDGT